MILPLWYAIVLGVSFIVFPLLIFYCTRLYPNYSIFRRTISGLGLPEKKSARIFNPTISIVGFILIPFPFFLLQALPAHWTTFVGIGSLICNPIGIILVGLFPEHKNVPHMVAAVLAMGGSLVANIFLLYSIQISAFHTIITIISIILLIVCIPLTFSFIKTGPSYVPDEKIDHIYENLNFWEWMQFITLQIWLLAIYLNLIIAF